jgi:hypothetical protein
MKYQEWNFTDKRTWGKGLWCTEPDKVQWQDEATGLPGLARRNLESGSWCAYVGVTDGHPLFNTAYEDLDLEVHGGITFADFCHEEDKEKGICHIPDPGEPDTVYWFGFDCNHHGDIAPGYDARYRDLFRNSPDLEQFMSRGVYRTLEYVKEECKNLAAQLKHITDTQHAQ